MKRSAGWPNQWIYYLAASFFYVAVLLRSILIYRESSELGNVLGLLLIWLVVAASEPPISRRWRGYFPIYLIIQTGLVLVLLALPGFPDFYAALLFILSMQAMSRLDPRVGAAWIFLSGLAYWLILSSAYGAQAVALTLICVAGNVYMGSYALAIRRNQFAGTQNQQLAEELEAANHQLQAYSAQLEGIAVARERNRLARELHDSVTQTVFSMTLATQSAVFLLKRDSNELETQLNRMSMLARSALAEMHMLIAELHPGAVEGGLPAALSQLIALRRLEENLSATLEITGNCPLSLAEEQGLFRIVQEALNNVIKHARTSQATVRLHLDEPFWVEVEDRGPGFDLKCAQTGGGAGLLIMRERAREIGWDLQINSRFCAGTRIRVEKKYSSKQAREKVEETTWNR